MKFSLGHTDRTHHTHIMDPHDIACPLTRWRFFLFFLRAGNVRSREASGLLSTLAKEEARTQIREQRQRPHLPTPAFVLGMFGLLSGSLHKQAHHRETNAALLDRSVSIQNPLHAYATRQSFSNRRSSNKVSSSSADVCWRPPGGCLREKRQVL